MIKLYYYMTKPGIIMGNIITMAGGFFLATKGDISFSLFFSTLIGLALVIASACVLNNYTDRDLDRKMERTKDRPLAQGLISSVYALLFSLILGIIGLAILTIKTNFLTAFIAFIGFVIYVVLYAFLKCRSIHGTLIGSLAGAVPPVVGYTAVSAQFDLPAFLLLAILVLWQMPHFFAIAIYHFDDYKAASIAVLPITQGIAIAKWHIQCYIALFCLAALSLGFLGYAGSIYTVTAAVVGLSWLALSFKGFQTENNTLWAKRMFRYSLIVITAISLTMIFH